MESTHNYHNLIKALLDDYTHYPPSHGVIETLPVFDDEHQQYLVLSIGWDGSRRVHGVIADVRLIDGKIWIEHDGTPPPGFALALVAAGVPKEDIVLAFHHPNVRPLTEFAAA